VNILRKCRSAAVLLSPSLLACSGGVEAPALSNHEALSTDCARKVVEIPVSKDAYVQSCGYPTSVPVDQNFGSAPTLYVNLYGCYESAFVGYPLAGIPQTATVTRAALVVPPVTPPGLGGSVMLYVVQDSTSWQESSLTALNAPAVDRTLDFVDIDAHAVNELDVTSLVAAAVAGGKSEISFAFYPYTNGYPVSINSKEDPNGQATSLRIEWR
jgi:hypothetical protein